MNKLVDYKCLEILLKESSNSSCADCGDIDISHVNSTFNTTLCKVCAGIHSHLRYTNLHLVGLEELKIETCEKTLKLVNNREANKTCEKYIPYYYRKINSNSAPILKEHWICLKYVDKKFQSQEPVTCLPYPTKKGVLWKKDRYKNIYKRRWFELLECVGTLTYFQSDRRIDVSKHTIKLHQIDVNFVPYKTEKANALQLDYLHDGKTRSLFVYTEKSSDILDWYYALLSNKFLRLQRQYPELDSKILTVMITGDILKEGWMDKSGPSSTHIFRRRWFTLVRKCTFSHTEWILRYYEFPLDSYPKGEVSIGKEAHGYKVTCRESETDKENVTIILTTPSRIYQFITANAVEQDSWKEQFERAIYKAF